MEYTVKKMAEISGVSIRTLHHYDEIGLLKPEREKGSGYRIYTEKDLMILQQILFYKEIGFELKEISGILKNPGYNLEEGLLFQKRMVAEQRERLTKILGLIEDTLESICKGDKDMADKKMFEALDDTKIEELKREARIKYGAKAVEESEKRTKGYTKEDWNRINEEMAGIFAEIGNDFDKDPGCAEVQELIARHHGFINEKFYTCTKEIYNGLADLYVADERFGQYFDAIKPGLAGYVSRAMKIYCGNLTRDIL